MTTRRGLAGEVETEVVVVGGGLTGCAAACELRRRHVRAVLLEAQVVGAGELRPGHVTTGPALVYPDAPGPAREAARARWQWTRDGHERLRDWIGALGVDAAYRAAGGFLLAATRADAARLAEAEDALREDTFSSEFLDHYMLEARFDVTGLAAALWMCDDADLDAPRLVRALGDEAASRGTRVHERSPVLRLEEDGRGVVAVTAAGRVRAAQALVCAGAATALLVPGLDAHWRPLTVATAGYTAASPAIPTPSRLLGGSLAWRAEGDGWRVAATGATADRARLERERDEAVARHLPAVRSGDGVAGPMAATADGLPLVGRVGGSPVVVAAGYGDDALALAPLAAAWAAAVLTEGATVPAAVAPQRGTPGDS